MIERWMEQPDKYIPKKLTIMNVIKWHLSLCSLMQSASRKGNSPCYKEDLLDIPTLADFEDVPECDSLLQRDRALFMRLGYRNVALIETCMLIGRELWYQNYNDSSQYNEELAEIDITDLDRWMQIFEIPLSISKGGNLSLATEYTISKIPEFLQSYIDKVDSLKKGA